MKDTRNPDYMRGFQDAVDLIDDELNKIADLKDAKKITQLVRDSVHEIRLPLIAETIYYIPWHETKGPSSEKKTEPVSPSA